MGSGKNVGFLAKLITPTVIAYQNTLEMFAKNSKNKICCLSLL